VKRCAISVDLDGLPCYYRIHGLGPPPAELEHVILERALPRAASFFAKRGVAVTWFVVGRDADADAVLVDRATRVANAARLRALADHGHELGNHSYSHPYDLARLSAAEIDDEIAGCDRVLRAITGENPRGFRAPGYDVSPAMLDSLAKRGYRYDSSIFPAPGYFNFELHGIDFADADRDGIPGELVARQPDLRVPIDEKLARLDAILDDVAATWSFATLAEVAADVQRTA